MFALTPGTDAQKRVPTGEGSRTDDCYEETVMAQIADRIAWAVETLDVQGDDDLLEIGCGHGVAVDLIAEKLTRGRITAIDRSDKMIAAAQKRNAKHIAAGKVILQAASLDKADFGD